MTSDAACLPNKISPIQLLSAYPSLSFSCIYLIFSCTMYLLIWWGLQSVIGYHIVAWIKGLVPRVEYQKNYNCCSTKKNRSATNWEKESYTFRPETLWSEGHTIKREIQVYFLFNRTNGISVTGETKGRLDGCFVVYLHSFCRNNPELPLSAILILHPTPSPTFCL